MYRQQDHRLNNGGINPQLGALIKFEKGILDDDFMTEISKGIEKDND